MARKPTPAAPAKTHNSDFTEEEFLSAVRTHDALKEAVGNANAAYGRFRKELKTRGIKLKVFDQVLGEREIDRKENIEDQAATMRMRRWLQIPVGKQAELFPPDAPKVSSDAAYLDGFQKGVAGKGQRKPPEQFASGKQQQEWLKGFDDGQKKIGLDIFGKKDFTKAPEPVKAEGPKLHKPEKESAKADGKGEVVSLADKRAAKSAPPTTPAKKERDAAAETVARVAAKKKAEKAKTGSSAKPAEAKEKPAEKAEKPAASDPSKTGGKKPATDVDLDDEFDLSDV